MANPTWPPTVPQKVTLSSSNEQWLFYEATSEMEKGQPHIRPLSTLSRCIYSGNIIMTRAQVLTFKNFIKASLSNRSKLVDGFTHPREGTTLNNVRIDNIGAPKPISTDYYEVAVTVSWDE